MRYKASLFPGSPVKGRPILVPFFVEDIKLLQCQAKGIGQRKADYTDGDSNDTINFGSSVFF